MEEANTIKDCMFVSLLEFIQATHPLQKLKRNKIVVLLKKRINKISYNKNIMSMILTCILFFLK